MKNNNYQKTTKLLYWIIFIGYSACLLYWMFWGFGRATHSEYRYNFIPFKTIFSYIFNINSHNIITTIINLAGNIGVFVPFGIVLPYIFKNLRRYKKFTTYFIGSVISLELMQTVLKVGTGDIDDVILNYIGGTIGFLFFRMFLYEQTKESKRINKSIE